MSDNYFKQLFENLESEGAKKKTKYWKKIAFEVVLAMQILPIKKCILYIYGRIFTKYHHGTSLLNPNDFWHERKIDNFDPYNVLLPIATNIPQRLKTGFVVQVHKC